MEYTPLNPSKEAINGVGSPVLIPDRCPYCCGKVELLHVSKIFSEEGAARIKYPWVYSCTRCHARVGIHPDTNIPLGTLANAVLRRKRRDVKKIFNRLHPIGTPKGTEPVFFTRGAAYQWLSGAMGVPTSKCHFGFFTEAQCDSALIILQTNFKEFCDE